MHREPSRSDRADSGTSARRIAALRVPGRAPGTRSRWMKRDGLLRHLRRHGCVLRREGKEHTLWENPQTGHAEAVPRHAEIANLLAKRICRKLSIPDPPG